MSLLRPPYIYSIENYQSCIPVWRDQAVKAVGGKGKNIQAMHAEFVAKVWFFLFIFACLLFYFFFLLKTLYVKQRNKQTNKKYKKIYAKYNTLICNQWFIFYEMIDINIIC